MRNLWFHRNADFDDMPLLIEIPDNQLDIAKWKTVGIFDASAKPVDHELRDAELGFGFIDCNTIGCGEFSRRACGVDTECAEKIRIIRGHRRLGSKQPIKQPRIFV